MASFTVEEILQATGGAILRKGSALRCGGVSTDTRTIREGDLFIPLSGENFNGHKFLKDAAEKGASMLLLSETEWLSSIPGDVTVIQTADPKLALEKLASFHRLRFHLPVIAVTGSNGKTTTKDMITAVLREALTVCHTEKNFNNEIGLSQTLLRLTEKDEACVVEMGMRGLGQIRELCEIAHPTIGVVTNVGTSHIGLLGSRENIGKAKAELVEALPPEGTAVLNEDDPLVSAMAGLSAGSVISFGIGSGRDVYADEVAFHPDGTSFVCHEGNHSFPVGLRLLGIHNVYDALAAAAVGRLLGVPPEKQKEALESFVSQSASQRILHVAGVTVLDDSYNANPLSVEMAMRALLQIQGNHHILVLGDMLELGRFAEELHRSVGERAAEMHFDRLITVGPLSRITAEAARRGGISAESYDSCEEAAQRLKETALPGDAVLIKGSHAMHMETIPGLWREEAE